MYTEVKFKNKGSDSRYRFVAAPCIRSRVYRVRQFYPALSRGKKYFSPFLNIGSRVTIKTLLFNDRTCSVLLMNSGVQHIVMTMAYQDKVIPAQTPNLKKNRLYVFSEV